MKVKFLVGCVGERFSHARGDIKDLPDHVAKEFIRIGYAEKTEEPLPECAAIEPQTEKAVRGRPRKRT